MIWRRCGLKGNSGDIARKRIKQLLLTDKTSCPAEQWDMLTEDIMDTVSKYFLIDSKGIEIQMERPNWLCTYIPIRDIRDKRT